MGTDTRQIFIQHVGYGGTSTRVDIPKNVYLTTIIKTIIIIIITIIIIIVLNNNNSNIIILVL